MKPAAIGQLIGSGMRRAKPRPDERMAAVSAADQAAAELGLGWVPTVRFFTGSDGYGRVLHAQPRTVWVRAGLPPAETVATVRHEVGHLAQRAAGQSVGHDGGDWNTWRRCTVERFAAGDRKAARRLARHVRAARTVIRITF